MPNNEYRILGPPGTGKTTRLATRDVPRAVEKFGRDKIMIVSFTRTAAREIATKKSRETGLPIDVDSKMVGTLHQICFHALGAPKITETLHKLWNSEHPNWAISGKASLIVEEDFHNAGNKGDKYLQALNIKRNKMESARLWAPSLIAFKKKWDSFKKETDSMDFTDLIETALKEMPYAPNQPDVIFVDEAQDSTPLQLALIRSWGQQTRWIILCGDDQQCLYRFTGATPRSIIYPEIDKSMITVLDQSYRLPQKILDRAMKISEKIKEKYPKKFSARKDWLGDTIEGKITEINATYKKPEILIEYAENKFKESKSVMFLASCNYMLEAVKKCLKDRGLPFGNKYRTRQADWNPLLTGTDGRTSAKDLIVAFVSNGIDKKFWNIPQFVKWAQHIKVGDAGLRRKVGKKGIETLQTAIENQAPGLHTAQNVYTQILTEEGAAQALDRNFTWLKENLKSTRKKSVEYPIKVYKKWGLEALEAPIPPNRNEPGICIGTVHSVKGGEADCVILFPDISFQAQDEFDASVEGKDSIYRMFYVGITRAYEELVLAHPAVPPNSKQTRRMYIEL